MLPDAPPVLLPVLPVLPLLPLADAVAPAPVPVPAPAAAPPPPLAADVAPPDVPWVDASDGRLVPPSRVFRDVLPCAYVLSDREHTGFLDNAAADPGLEQVLANDQMVLYRVQRDRPPSVYPKDVDGAANAG